MKLKDILIDPPYMIEPIADFHFCTCQEQDDMASDDWLIRLAGCGVKKVDPQLLSCNDDNEQVGEQIK